MNHTLPNWCMSLHSSLEAMAEKLSDTLKPMAAGKAAFFPEDFGYVPGHPATRFIQLAIEAAAEKGGTVRLLHGDYVSGTLELRSGVRLEIGAGARLLASTRLEDFPEHHARRLTVQDTSMGMHQSLIFAEDCEDIALAGQGIIDGQGSPRNFPGEETAQGTPGRPFVIRMIDCKRVHISGLTMKNSPCWMQNYLNCEQLLVENLTVRNHANYNNDGIDLDGCRDVIVRNCRISSGDDALCFKGASQRPTERVLVENCDFYSACNAVKVGTDTQGDFRNVWVRHCRIGGLSEDPSGLKHPCSDSGISLEMVDGGTLENFLFSDISIYRAWSPFFLRLENRGRVKPGDPTPPVGTLRRILFEKIRGEGNGPRGSYMLGIPEKKIEDIVFSDVRLSQYAWDGPIPDESDYPELRGVYPDAHMIDSIGPSPAQALWARHVRGLLLKEVEIIPDGPDPRPELVENTDVC